MSQTLTPPAAATLDSKHEKTRANFYQVLGLVMGPLSKERTEDLNRELAETTKAHGKAAKAQHKRDKPAAKEEVIYTDRLMRSEATLAALEEYRPVSDDLIATFTGMIARAKTAAASKPPAWEAATTIMHEQSATHALERMETAWREREGKARKSDVGGPVFKELDLVRAEIGKAETLTSAVLADLQSAADEAERFFLGAVSDKKTATATISALGDLQTRLMGALKEASKARGRAETARTAAQAAYDALSATDEAGPLTTDTERAVLLRSMRDAETAVSLREFKLAASQFEDVKTAADSLVADNAADRSAWAIQAVKVAKLRSDAVGVASTATSPDVRTGASNIVMRLDEIEERGPGDGISYHDAADRVTGSQTQLVALQAMEQSFVAFKRQRDSAAKQIVLTDALVGLALTQLHEAVHAATGGKQADIADAPFRTVRAKVLEEWGKRLQTAYDLPTLGADRAESDLNKIASDIKATAGNPALLTSKIAEGALDDARKPFETARQATLGHVKALTDVDANRGGNMMREIREQDEVVEPKLASPLAYASATAEMTAIGTRARDLIGRQKDIVDGLKWRLDELLKALSETLQQVLAAKMPTNEEKAKYLRSLQETLSASYDELRAVSMTTQVPLLNAAVDDAVALQKDMDAAVIIASGKTPKGDDAPYSFDEARKKLKKAKEKISGDTVKTYCLPAATDLLDRIAGLDKDPGALNPTALRRELDVLEKASADLYERAKKEQKAVADFKKDEFDVLKARLDREPFKDAKNCVAALKADFQSIYANACYDGGLGDAQIALTALKGRLDELAHNFRPGGPVPPAIGLADDAEAERVRAQEVARERFDAEVKVLERQIGGLETFARDKEGLAKSLKEIKDAAPASKDIEQQRDLLQGVRDRLALLSNNPLGLGIHVRNRLPQVNRRWQEAVAAFGAALDSLRQIIVEIDDADLDATGKTAVTKTLESVRVLFNPKAFEAALAILANEAVTDVERSSARESALREVRRIGANIGKDYRLQELLDCPFLPTMRSRVAELNLALLDLENNALVSM